MQAGHFISELACWLLQAIDVARRFGAWWLSELLALLPPKLANWLVEGGSRSVVLAPGDGMVTFMLLSDQRRVLASVSVNQADYSLDLFDSFLRSNNQRRTGVSTGLRMPSSSVFYRRVLLPIEVRRVLDATLAQDLAAKTPFQFDEVYHGHAAKSNGNTIDVRQWIVRRKHVVAAVDALGIELDDLSFIEAQHDGEEGGPLPPVTLREPSSAQQCWARRTNFVLTFSALLLACVAAALRFEHQQTQLDSLEVEMNSARSRAQQTLAALKDLERATTGLDSLRVKRTFEHGLLDIWQETTRLLPDHSWLTELRVSETPVSRQVVMTGFSRAAAALVPLVERSPMFGEAALVAPISLDQAEDRERFSIQATVKSADTNRTVLK